MFSMFSSSGQPKPKPKPIPIQPTQFDSNDIETMSALAGWRCNSCTYINDSTEPICSMCAKASEFDRNPQQSIPLPSRDDMRSGQAGTGIKHQSDSFVQQELSEFLYKCNTRLSSHKSQEVTMQTAIFFPDGSSLEKVVTVKSQDLIPFLSASTSRISKQASSTDQRPHNNGHSPLSPPHTQTSLSPVYDPGEGFHTAQNVFVESQANAGKAGGERVSKNKDSQGIDNSSRLEAKQPSTTPSFLASANGKFGPRQLPPREVISLHSRNIELADGGGARVNQDSSRRIYDLGNYERSVLIDPLRHTHTPSREAQDDRASGASAESTGVPVEVAAVAAKIRNISRVGGERVKEMDHFVASVETPVLRLRLDGSTDTAAGDDAPALRQNDIAAYVQSAIKSDRLQRSNILTLQATAVDGAPCVYTVLVEEQYCDPLGGGECAGHVRRYCELFHSFLVHVFDILCVQFSDQHVQLYYMTTMRADELVCSKAALPDGRLYINAQVFQQSDCFDVEGDKSKPVRITPSRLREQLSSWTTRVAIAMQKGLPQGARPVGLYDKETRTRFYNKLLTLGADLRPIESGIALMSTTISSSSSAAGGTVGARGWGHHDSMQRIRQLLQTALEDAIKRQDRPTEKRARERLAAVEAGGRFTANSLDSASAAAAAAVVPLAAGPALIPSMQFVAPHSSTLPIPPSSSSSSPSPPYQGSSMSLHSATTSSVTTAEAEGLRAAATDPRLADALRQLVDFFGSSGWGSEELLWVLQANGGEVEATIDAILNIGSVDLVRDQMRH